MDRECYLCKKEIGLFNRKTFWLYDGYVCYDCINKLGIDVLKYVKEFGDNFQTKSCDEFILSMQSKSKTNIDYISRQNTLKEKFKTTCFLYRQSPDTNIVDAKINSIELDEDNKLLRYRNRIYKWEQIVNYELHEDNSTIMKGGVGRAIIGDILTGVGGALVGAATRKSKNVAIDLSILIGFDDNFAPLISISFINSATKRDSIKYKNALIEAKKIITKLDSITNNGVYKESNNDSLNYLSSADEIRKYKSLLDDGIITQEEFNIKKKELLSK